MPKASPSEWLRNRQLGHAVSISPARFRSYTPGYAVCIVSRQPDYGMFKACIHVDAGHQHPH